MKVQLIEKDRQICALQERPERLSVDLEQLQNRYQIEWKGDSAAV
jgi:hypothetical protein